MIYSDNPKAQINFIVEGEGKPLILLHGFFYDTRIYREFISILAKRYKVYAVDLPIHGKTRVMSKMTTEEFSIILHDFAAEQKIIEPTIVGHSWGALFALFYAAKFRTKRLIMIEPAGLKYYNSILPLLSRVFIIQPVLCLKESMPKSLLIFGTAIRNISSIVMNKGAFGYLEEDLFIDHSYLLQKIKCRTTIIWARNDEILPYSFAEEYTRKIRNSRLIMVEGTHNWPILRPGMIEEYLE
jgi:pimeloyl-ACP methyl ester carboxylesterase